MVDGVGPSLFRTARFHATVALVWRENPDHPGIGELLPAVDEHLPQLWERASSISEDQAPWIFVLGLLLESEGPATLQRSVRDFLSSKVDALLHLLAQAVERDDAQTPQHIQALMYVLGQLNEHRAAILDRSTRIFPAGTEWAQAAQQLFSEDRPARFTRSVIAYLGAGAAGTIVPDRLPLLEAALACPGCGSALAIQAEPAAMVCTSCHSSFAFQGDIIDLRSAELREAADAEFDQGLVDRYESMTRPRFVRTMSRDWGRSLTPEVEEAYLTRHLHADEGLVLDLACGAGGWTEMVGRQVGAERVLALDVSLPMVQSCLRRVPSAIGICGDAMRLPLQDASLAGANCSDALQAIPDPGAALREVSRCLRPGAPFTAFTFVQGDTLYRYFQHRVPLHARHLFTPGRLRGLLADAGLELLDWSQRGLAVFLTARRA
jgi:ubiquinone/menaquinone biosynthesis C-methylase UbiE